MENYQGQSRLADTVRGNPLPLALMGLGIGWLLMNGVREATASRGSGERGGRRGLGYGSADTAGYAGSGAAGYGYGGGAPDYGSSDYAGYGSGASGMQERGAGMEGGLGQMRERAAGTARELRERAAEYGHRVQERAQGMATTARTRASQVGRKVRYQAGNLADRSAETFNEHPLMIGSMALLVGAAIGASLPRTRNENRMFGHTRDEVMDRARAIGSEKWEKAKQVAARTAEAARESGQQAFENIKETAKQSTEEAIGQVRDTAKTEAERQHLAGRDDTPGSIH